MAFVVISSVAKVIITVSLSEMESGGDHYVAIFGVVPIEASREGPM